MLNRDRIEKLINDSPSHPRMAKGTMTGMHPLTLNNFIDVCGGGVPRPMANVGCPPGEVEHYSTYRVLADRGPMFERDVVMALAELYNYEAALIVHPGSWELLSKSKFLGTSQSGVEYFHGATVIVEDVTFGGRPHGAMLCTVHPTYNRLTAPKDKYRRLCTFHGLDACPDASEFFMGGHRVGRPVAMQWRCPHHQEIDPIPGAEAQSIQHVATTDPFMAQA